jgi:acyl-CoA synthetase (AMP-forming)/AMP-acid ligase II
MDEIITKRSGNILRVELNRPTKRNAMTSRMYEALADIFNEAAKDERTRVVLWHGAGDSFCAGNDVEDFLKNPPGPEESPQAWQEALAVFLEKPFRDGMFRTGDIGYRDADGYFYILDRVKDMIVTGGENVYCGEVEAVIYEHPAVLEAAVFGIPDPQYGELVAACVVPKPGTNLSTDDLIAHCRRFLANYKIPRHIEFSKTELPKSGSGKILKRLLRERFWVGQKRAVG